MIEVFIPIVLLSVAVITTLFDTKKNPRHVVTYVVVSLLIVGAFGSGWLSWQKTKANEEVARQATKDKDIVLNSLSELTSRVGKVDSTVVAINTQLDILGALFGQRKENRSVESLKQGLAANESLVHLSSANHNGANNNITVQYFPKDIDRDTVKSALLSALQEAGFTLIEGVGYPPLERTPTNSIWYGTDVPADSIRAVALALVRAGIKVRGIQPFSGPSIRSKARIVQIGSYALVQQKSPYSVETISSMQFPK